MPPLSNNSAPFGGNRLCLADGTPVVTVIRRNAGTGAYVHLGYVNLVTGTFTPGNCPAGTGVCAPQEATGAGGSGGGGTGASSRIFNIERFGAARSPDKSFDSTRAFLDACDAAANSLSDVGSHVNHEATATVYVPAGEWVGRFEIRANGIRLQGEGQNTVIYAPVVGGGEPATSAVPTQNGYPMIGFQNSDANETPATTAPKYFWTIQDLAFWGGTGGVGAGTTRMLLDTTSNGVNTLGGSGNNHIQRIWGYKFGVGTAGEVAMFFSRAGCSFCEYSDMTISGRAQAVHADVVDSGFTNLQVQGAYALDDAVIRLSGATTRLANSKIFAGGFEHRDDASGIECHGLSLENAYSLVSNVEIQDNHGYGLILRANQGVAAGLYSGSAEACVTRGVILDGNLRNIGIVDCPNGGHDIEAFIGPADFDYVYESALDLKGQVGKVGTNGSPNRFMINVPMQLTVLSDGESVTPPFQIVRLLPGPAPASHPAPLLDAAGEILLAGKDHTNITTLAAGATLTPDPRNGMSYNIILNGNATVAAMLNYAAVYPTDIVIFTVTQGGVGNFVITWDPSWGSVPVLAAGAGQISFLPFVNLSRTLTPVWRYQGDSVL